MDVCCNVVLVFCTQLVVHLAVTSRDWRGEEGAGGELRRFKLSRLELLGRRLKVHPLAVKQEADLVARHRAPLAVSVNHAPDLDPRLDLRKGKAADVAAKTQLSTC